MPRLPFVDFMGAMRALRIQTSGWNLTVVDEPLSYSYRLELHNQDGRTGHPLVLGREQLEDDLATCQHAILTWITGVTGVQPPSVVVPPPSSITRQIDLEE